MKFSIFFGKLLLLFAALLCILLIYIAVPRQYDVQEYIPPMDQKRWDLANGSSLSYQYIPAEAADTNSPIVYLHGGPGGYISEETVSSLRPFAKFGYSIYAYDQIGSGGSKRLPNIQSYTLDRHIEDLKFIIESIGAEKVTLLGQSWGSVLATFFVSKYPELVDRIIMTGPGPIFPINQKVASVIPPDSLNIIKPAYSNRDANELYTFRIKCIDRTAQIMGKRLASDNEMDDFFTHLNTALIRSTVCDTSLFYPSGGGSGYYAHIMTMKSLYESEDPRNALENLDTPLLILKGQCDNQKWGFAQEYLTYFSNAKLKIIPGAGHNLALEQPDKYQKTILSFLQSNVPNKDLN